MYQSPVDLLQISISELENLDAKAIIRLEKRLRLIHRQQNNTAYNKDLQFELLDQLKQEDTRACILFVERHPHFKTFLKNGECTAPKVFNFDSVSEEIPASLASFLAPYMEALFIPILKNSYRNKNFDIINQALSADYLFTVSTLQFIYDYIIQQTELLAKSMHEVTARRMYLTHPEVTYKSHIKLLNAIPIGQVKSVKIDYINALVEYYNKTKTANREYEHMKYAYRLFSAIEIDDPNLQDHLSVLARLGYEEPGYQTTAQNKESKSYAGQIFAIIIGVIVFVAKMNRAQNSYVPSRDVQYKETSVYNQQVSNVFSDFQTRYMKKLFGRTYILNEVYYDSISTNFKTGQSIQNYFNSLTKIKNGRPIWIRNDSDHQAFVFSTHKKQPVFFNSYIAPGDSLQIHHRTETDYYFYTGDEYTQLSYADASESTYKRMSKEDLATLQYKYKVFIANDSSKIRITDKGVQFDNISIDRYKNTYLSKYRVPENLSVINAPKTAFFKRLLRMSSVRPRTMRKLRLRNGANPYPNQFKGKDHKTLEGQEIIVKNNDERKGLLVFNRNTPEERNYATYVVPGKQVRIKVKPQKDTLYFYSTPQLWRSKKGDTLVYLTDKNRVLAKKPYPMKKIFKPYMFFRFYKDKITIIK